MSDSGTLEQGTFLNTRMGAIRLYAKSFDPWATARSCLSFSLHPNVGGQGYGFGIVGLSVGPYCEGTQARILYDRWFNREQEVLDDHPSS